MTKTAYLAAAEAALRSQDYPWAADPAKFAAFMAKVRDTLDGKGAVAIDSVSFLAAWKAIGGKGKPTYKALRALPEN